MVPPTDTEFPVKYPDGHALNPKKVDDLQSMIPYLQVRVESFMFPYKIIWLLQVMRMMIDFLLTFSL